MTSWTACSPLVFFVPGIFWKARTLEWVVVSYSWDSSTQGFKSMTFASRDFAGRSFTTEPPEKPIYVIEKGLIQKLFIEMNKTKKFCHSELGK